MNRVLLGIRGAETEEQMREVLSALKNLEGVARAETEQLGQVVVEYDPHRLTVMDLIRAVRERGFLAGML
jgi:copper chaperone CopZ